MKALTHVLGNLNPREALKLYRQSAPFLKQTSSINIRNSWSANELRGWLEILTLAISQIKHERRQTIKDLSVLIIVSNPDDSFSQ